MVQQEHVARRERTSEEATEVGEIEATAASLTAWLISITVPIEGFLSDVISIDYLHSSLDLARDWPQVTCNGVDAGGDVGVGKC